MYPTDVSYLTVLVTFDPGETELTDPANHNTQQDLLLRNSTFRPVARQSWLEMPASKLSTINLNKY